MTEWIDVEKELPEVGTDVLVASHDNLRGGWRVATACLLIRHEGVLPRPELVKSRPVEFYFDAPRGNDMRLLRPGMFWAIQPEPAFDTHSKEPKT